MTAVLFIVGTIVAVIGAFVGWCCLKVASDADDMMADLTEADRQIAQRIAHGAGLGGGGHRK